MKTNSVNVLGYTGNNSQFVVKTLNANLRISQNQKYPELEGPNPYEYLLAGFAGCINALGQQVAAELGMPLRSLQVEITGEVELLAEGRRAGFSNIAIILRPSATANPELLFTWLEEVRKRSPAYNSLVNATPVDLLLYKAFSYN